MSIDNQTPSPASNPLSPPPPKPRGAVGWGILWLLGIPLPILLGLFLLRGCT